MSLAQREMLSTTGERGSPRSPNRCPRDTDPTAYSIRAVSACGGTLGFGDCPGLREGRFRADRLTRDLDRIAEWQPAAVVCLLADGEVEGLDLTLLSHEVRLRGMGWLQPGTTAEDDGPSGQRDWQTIAPRLHAALTSGGRLLLHGASGTERGIAAAERLLVENGVTASAARAQLSPALLTSGT